MKGVQLYVINCCDINTWSESVSVRVVCVFVIMQYFVCLYFLTNFRANGTSPHFGVLCVAYQVTLFKYSSVFVDCYC